MKISCLLLLVLLFSACSIKNPTDKISFDAIQQKIKKLTEEITELEKKDNLKGFMIHYDNASISMPEYQLTLTGPIEVKAFYKEIFARQKIKAFKKNTEEIIVIDSIAIEIGTFKKEYLDSVTDSAFVQNGKYWNIWSIKSDGSLKIKGEAFGYFHPIKNADLLVVQSNNKQPSESEVLLTKQIPIELKAYNALMEKGVRNRDGILRAEFFTDNAQFMPFADSTKKGIEKIKPYLIAYNAGTVTIDSIMVYTYDYEKIENYVIEYSMFKVKWSVPQLSGRTEGKGIRIWKRQEDNSLKLFREIGTHNLSQ
jgi:ketosteroid isomerase-like protein